MLIKELHDYNKILYPITIEDTIEYLLKVGFLCKSEKPNFYRVSMNIPSPKKVFDFPPEWQDRFDKFIETGSVLFAYLSIEEIINS